MTPCLSRNVGICLLFFRLSACTLHACILHVEEKAKKGTAPGSRKQSRFLAPMPSSGHLETWLMRPSPGKGWRIWALMSDRPGLNLSYFKWYALVEVASLFRSCKVGRLMALPLEGYWGTPLVSSEWYLLLLLGEIRVWCMVYWPNSKFSSGIRGRPSPSHLFMGARECGRTQGSTCALNNVNWVLRTLEMHYKC